MTTAFALHRFSPAPPRASLFTPWRAEACVSRGYQLVETYEEPGASATNDRRPELQRMIEAATSKPTPFVLTGKNDVNSVPTGGLKWRTTPDDDENYGYAVAL